MKRIENEKDMPMFQEPDKDGYIEHICCEDSRRHVLRWDSNGEHCSESNCEINKPKEKNNIGCIGIAGSGSKSYIAEILRKYGKNN